MNHEKTLWKNLLKDDPGKVLQSHTRITPPSKWPHFHLGELWAYRDLLWILIWRYNKMRYAEDNVVALNNYRTLRINGAAVKG
jgi:hypothetical protein